jgi:hypothetical protein
MDKDKAIRSAKLTAAGILDKARARTAVTRAGGQIAPSKYLPNVPRQVHADGGKVAFMQGNHPLVPDVLYHGTARDIQSFDPDAKRSYDVDPLNPEETDTGWFGKGHYFTASPKLAAHYADEGAKRQGGQGASIIPAHVAMKNPFIVNMRDYDSGAKSLDNALSRAGVPMHPRGYRMPSEQTAALVGMGHDGVIATREGKPEEYVAFHPTQIKSAIGNQGTFDPNDPDITKADGGRVDDDRAAFLAGNPPDVPEVLYHGSFPKIATKGWTDEVDEEQTQKNRDAQDFRTFKPSEYGNFGSGIYLSDSPMVASNFAQGIRGENTEVKPHGQVLKLHVSMKNPFADSVLRHPAWKDYIKDEIKKSLWLNPNSTERPAAADLISKLDNDTATVRDLFMYDTPDGTMLRHLGQDKIHKTIRNSGFDGIIAHRHDGSKEYVAFKPEQVKSATGNQGTFDPNDPDMTKAAGGRIHAEDGGKMELRSRAAEAIRNQPQLKGNVNQLLAVAAKGKGVKQAELANAGQPSGNIISKEELARHFEDALPKVQVKKLKNKEPDPLSSSEMAEYRRLEADPFGYGQDGYDRLQELEDRQRGEIKARYQQYTLPQGENYREHLLHLPAEHGPNSWTNFRSSHWETPNVLAHLRMKDRDNGKTLHVEEVQSDWAQTGRTHGFYDTAKPFHVFDINTGQTVHEAPSADEAQAVADKLGPQYDYASQHDEKVPQGPYVGNTQHWTDLAVKHALTEAAKGGHDRVVFSPGEANADMYGQRTPITNARLVWASPEAGYLYTRKKDAKYDSDAIQFQGEKHLSSLLGKQHAKALLAQDGLESSISEPDMHLGGHGMVDYYNNIVHPSALKLLQQHDPSIKPESYDLPNGYKGFGLPMTETARQSILKNGFGAFKRGGMVGKEEGGSVTDTDEFRNWFRNSATHTDGDPHVLYTGTSKDKDFTSFNVGRHGAWFTRDPAEASEYAERNDSQGYKQDGWKLTPINTASRVIPAYVKAENPYTGDLPDEVLRDNYKKAQSDWFDTLRRKGHDAWIPARHNGDLVVVLKEPQQIKSIFNNGKFDPNQKHMNKAGGGMVGKEEGGATGSLREKALWPSAQAIKAGTGSREAHEALVNKIKPVSPYATPVPPASDQQVHDALTKDKQPKAFAPRALGEGTPVAVRLDIPAYEKRNTWVVSVHHPKSDFTAGEVIGYDSVAHIGNPRFGVHPTGALNIASGKPKATIATVHGNWKKTTPEDAFRLSQTVHNDPQWRQVGMDPERHSYFYDRETQEPVMSADEALHIGPLVYAKNPVYGKKTDFAFSSGGDVSAALALTRRFTKDGAGATMALKPKGK